jgi:hypothetical protein
VPQCEPAGRPSQCNGAVIFGAHTADSDQLQSMRQGDNKGAARMKGAGHRFVLAVSPPADQRAIVILTQPPAHL